MRIEAAGSRNGLSSILPSHIPRNASTAPIRAAESFRKIGLRIEAALVSGKAECWRAANAATQTIRLLFDHPQRLTHISLVFEETETERNQQFVLRWSSDGGRSFQEIVRQLWNFSPPNAVREIEDYRVDLSGVRRKKALWGKEGRAQLESFLLLPWAARRRQDLLGLLDRLKPIIADLNKAVEKEAERRPEVRRLMTHPGVGPTTALALVLMRKSSLLTSGQSGSSAPSSLLDRQD